MKMNEVKGMKWFECRAEKVEMIYQLIEAKNAQDAERQFREMYPDVGEVYVKEKVENTSTQEMKRELAQQEMKRELAQTPRDRLREANTLAVKINRDRFEGNMPSAEDTVRLIELLGILWDAQ
jgi:hypothetical protein